MLHELHLRITGYVQRVGFRLYMQERACALQINGHVSNLADGSVAVIAQGTQENLQRLIRYAQLGPAYAQVEAVHATWHEPRVVYTGFHGR